MKHRTSEYFRFELIDSRMVDVYFEYHPFEPGRNFLSNGDVGYPDELEEIEIGEIELVEGKGIINLSSLSETQIDLIYIGAKTHIETLKSIL